MTDAPLQSLPAFPWYDSFWLTSFVRVKQYLAAHHPVRLAEFMAALEPLRTPMDFRIREIPDLFDAEVHAQLVSLLGSLKLGETEKHELLAFGRLILHDQALLNHLQQTLTPLVSNWVGEEVEPSYNFLSLYNNLGICAPHMDAPSAKWTVDYCINQSAPWPIHFSQIIPWPEQWLEERLEERPEPGSDWASSLLHSPLYQYRSYVLEPNQALVFAGSSQWHYRERIAQLQRQNFCNLAFFHFVPKGLRPLTNPGNWPALFGLPELQSLVIPEP